MISEPRLRALLRQAEKVADSGKRAAAENLYRQIVEEAPDAAEAWLGLAGVVTDAAEQERAYQRVLRLEPDNQAAQVALAELRGKPLPDRDEAVPGDTADDSVDDAPFGQTPDWISDALSGRSTPEPQPAVTLPEPDSTRLQSGDGQIQETAVEETFELACYRHPNRNTSLRCYTCGRPICMQCAIKTPVGYRCPDCVREAEEVFFTARPTDYILAPLVTLPLSLIAGYLVLRLGSGFFFIFIMLFIGGAVGSFIGQIGKRVVGRRRGRYLPHVVAATVVLGVVIPVLLFVPLNLVVLFRLITPGIYLFVATTSAFYQMK